MGSFFKHFFQFFCLIFGETYTHVTLGTSQKNGFFSALRWYIAGAF